jgi:hypothetical protein
VFQPLNKPVDEICKSAKLLRNQANLALSEAKQAKVN